MPAPPVSASPRWRRLTSFTHRLFGASPKADPNAAALKADIRVIAESGLFDATHYRLQKNVARKKNKPQAHNASVTDRDAAALIGHYLRQGAADWLNPSREFDTGYYIDSNPELASGTENPLLHYLRTGRASGRPASVDPALWSPGDVPTVPWPLPVVRNGPVYIVPAYIADRNTTRYRVRHLAELVGEETLRVIDWENPTEDFFPALAAGARVILQRLPLNEHTQTFIHRVRAAARLVAYDIDDQIFNVNELEDWRLADLSAPPAQYARCMALADHFLVSTTALRAKVERRFGRPAHVVTNVLGRETLARSIAAGSTTGSKPFVIGYAAGSNTHDADLATIIPAIRRFLQDNPDATFHCVGRMAFPKDLAAEFGDRVRFQKAVPWTELPGVLAEFTVHVLPLTDCAFNRYKSHIRFLEAAAVGVPSIVSRVGEPATSVIDGVTGLVRDNDVDAWIEALQTLHDSPDLRKRMAEVGKQFVTSFMTTAAPFARNRTLSVLDDLHLGILRDRIGILVSGGDPGKVLQDVRRTMSLPWNAYLTSPLATKAANVLGVDAGNDIGAIAGFATERFLAVIDEPPLDPLWDLRLVQTAKEMPGPGWLSADVDAAGGPINILPGGLTVIRAARGGHGPFILPASSRDMLMRSKTGVNREFPVAAPQSGLFTGVAPIAADRGAGPHSIAIKVCTPIASDENAWGDTHFARGLASALGSLGYSTRVDKREEWYETRRRTEIAIHLFGTTKYKPDPSALNILWIISHPEDLDAEFLRGFDVIYYPSESIPDRLRALAQGQTIVPLLQCTDAGIFFPDHTIAKDLDVVFIGNSRRVNREAVRYAVENGFELALWGTLWEPFVDKRLIRGTGLRSEEVAGIYRRARVVLNDHWADQKADGLVNNRIFDALACDTMVLSDANPGLDTLLGGAVPTFTDSADFATKLRALLDDPEREQRAAALGAQVRRDHTFAQRARVMHEAITRLKAERAPNGRVEIRTGVEHDPR